MLSCQAVFLSIIMASPQLNQRLWGKRGKGEFRANFQWALDSKSTQNWTNIQQDWHNSSSDLWSCHVTPNLYPCETTACADKVPFNALKLMAEWLLSGSLYIYMYILQKSLHSMVTSGPTYSQFPIITDNWHIQLKVYLNVIRSHCYHNSLLTILNTTKHWVWCTMLTLPYSVCSIECPVRSATQQARWACPPLPKFRLCPPNARW